MPQAAVAIGVWVAGAVATAVAPIGAALGVATLGTTVGTAVGSFVASLGFAQGLMAGVSAWATVASFAMPALMKAPKPRSVESGGQLLSRLEGENAGLPIIFGRSAVAGNVVHRAAYGGTGKNEHLVHVNVLSVGPIEGWEKTFVDDKEVVFATSPTLGNADATGYIGQPADSKYLKNGTYKQCVKMGWLNDESHFYSDPTMPLYSDAAKLQGLASVATLYIYNTEAYSQGQPRSVVHIIKGVKAYDPRKDSTYPGGSGSHRINDPATWEFTENPAIIGLLWCHAYLWTEDGEKVIGLGCQPDEVDIPAFIDMANTCDANDWKIGGLATSADDPLAVLDAILAAGSAVAASRGTQISCIHDAPKVSTYTIDKRHVVGTVEINNSTPWRDRYNAIVPTYREEAKFWELTPGNRIAISEYIENDDGEEKTVEISLPYVQAAKQAHQIATYSLLNTREFLTFTLDCNLSLLGVEVGDVITVDLPEDLSTQEGGQTCLVLGKTIDLENFVVRLSLRSEDVFDKHEYSLGRSDNPPDDPSLGGYDPTNPPQPGEDAWAITGTSFTDANGVVQPGIIIEGEPDDPNAAEVLAEYVDSTGGYDANTAVWIQHSAVPAATARKFVIGPPAVLGGHTYHAAISYKTVAGVTTPRLVLGPVTLNGITIPWNPNVIVDGPLNPDGQINSWFVDYQAQTLAEVLAEWENVNNAVANSITFINNTISHYDDVLFPAFDANVANVRVRVQDLESAVANIDGDFASASDLETLETEIVAARGGYGNMNARFGALTTTITDGLAGKASATSFNTLQTEIQNARNGAGTLKSRIDTFESATSDALAGKASATSFSNLQSEVTTARNGQSSLSARITQVNSTAVDAASDAAAAASSVSSMSSTVSGHTSSISSLQSVTNGMTAKYSLMVNGSGGITGIQIASGTGSQTGQSIKMVSSNFSIVDTSGNGIVPFAAVSGTVYINNSLYLGSAMKVHFDGANNRFVIQD